MPCDKLEAGFDIEALSGILGSISIACWLVVFTPQIVENFRRHSADGLSIVFIVIWLLGDIFNVIGAMLQGVLPTMIILAVYYTVADIVLMGQVFWYRGFTLSDAPREEGKRRSEEAVAVVNGDGEEPDEEDDEETPLLARGDSPIRTVPPPSALTALTPASAERMHRRSSASSLMEHIRAVDGAHLSPATPLVVREADAIDAEAPAARMLKPRSSVRAFIFNLTALVLVCAAGALGWYLTTKASRAPYCSVEPTADDSDPGSGSAGAEVRFDLWGQIFGYLCCVFYLGSRVPQLLLNYRRKSTEGVSMLFFLFACVGNLTYVLSILAYEPSCARWNGRVDYGNPDGLPRICSDGCGDGGWASGYARYVGVNASWLAGSAGTLLLDFGIFAQFWIYRGRTPDVQDRSRTDSVDGVAERDDGHDGVL